MNRGPMARGQVFGTVTAMATTEGTRAGGASPAAPPTDPPAAVPRPGSPSSTSPPEELTGNVPAREAYGLALGALGAALLTLAFDDHGATTLALLVVALVPWALLAGGIRLPTWLFVVWAIAPAAVIVATENAGGPIFLGLLTGGWVFSETGRWWVRWPTMAAVLALPVVLVVVDEGSVHESGAHYFVAGALVIALAGEQSYRQRLLTAKLQWSLSRLDAAAAAEERRRVARDVHDVVAHSLTVVMLNVSGARKALASHPELAAEALDRAETVGRESLDGIRRVVGLLRAGDEPGVGGPQPTARDLPAVVEQQRQAGATASLDVTGDLDGLDPLTGATVVRLVQEGVTNAQRHAPGAPVDVRLAVEERRVTVTVDNGPAQRPPLDRDRGRQGLGLLGMRERVEALGGTVTAGPSGEGWTLTAELPRADRGSASGGAR
jgi:signal transduction histidine kinase